MEAPASERTRRRQRAAARRVPAEERVRVRRERSGVPVGLSARALTAWRQIVEDLEGLGVLAHSDRGAVEALAVLVGRAREARAHVNKDGAVDVVSGRVSPWWQVEQRSWERAIRYYSELGLSPSARARLGLVVGRVQRPARERGVGADAEAPARGSVAARIGESPRLRAVP